MKSEEIIRQAGNRALRPYSELLRGHGDEGRLYVAEGLRLAQSALAASQIPVACFFSESFSRGHEETCGKFRDQLPSACTCYCLSDSLFHRFADTKNPQGILLIFERPDEARLAQTFNSILRREDCRLVVLEDVQDPGNVGSAIRTAEALGYDALLYSPACARPYKPKVLRAAMGATFFLPLFPFEDTIQLCWTLKSADVACIAASLKGRNLEKCVTNPHRLALWIGNEANGLSSQALEQAAIHVRIPMKGRSESLNATAALAILTYAFSARD